MKRLATGSEEAPVLSRDELEALDKKAVEVNFNPRQPNKTVQYLTPDLLTPTSSMK